MRLIKIQKYKSVTLTAQHMEWTRGKTIGHGSSATVSIGKDNKSGEIFAIKTVKLSHADHLKNEKTILATLKCPQIVSYKGCDISYQHGHVLYNLFMEYVPGGTLTGTIHNHGGRLDEATIRSYTRQILKGLVYLHASDIVHCDIKGENILIDHKNGIKIADLGCARRVNEKVQDYMAGTPVYMAPEVARGERQGCPADVWALGCTVLEMATGKPPWSGVVSDPVNALYRIGFSGDVPEIPGVLSEEARDFVGKCLKRDPTERWSASELLEHGFLDMSSRRLAAKEISNRKWETPTSVLNQGFWESLETVQKQSCSKCPKERIQQLSEGKKMFSTRMSDLELDDGWITLRSKVLGCVQEDGDSSCASELTSTSGTDVAQNNDGMISVCNRITHRKCMKRSSLMAFRCSTMYVVKSEMSKIACCPNKIEIPLPKIKKSKSI